ncbi:MAG: phosphoglycerate kinase [Candidatus Pacebacteria bacterium]|nr:phosphoglycerate kinase [Candidatus Paceibacterota bacterium]MBP9843087.1 phosphoglycerate kinase [Candidatus Paceibacterota bacterium]
MKKITDVADLKGKRVIVRASLNIPLENGRVRNAFRLKRALPTLRYLQEQGARVVIISHIGRKPEETLKPVFDELEKDFPIHWGGVVTGEEFKARAELLTDGTFLMAENLRQDNREEENDVDFAEYLAQFGDIYVNDAFAEAHREHASLHALARLLPAYAGLNLLQEVQELQKVMTPQHPSLFLLGGAKFETKMPLIKKYLDVYDFVFVGGALANDIFKAKGFEVGKSLVSDESIAGAAFLESPKLIIPVDVVVEGPNGVRTCLPNEVQSDEKIFDCGAQTTALLASYIEKSATVLWNGPFGNYEAGFEESTEETMHNLARSSAFSVVGGGDTVAAIEKLGLNENIGFVSIGGGAMLTYLEEGRTSVLDLLD